MTVLTSLLVLAHLLAMAGFIAAFFLQRKTARGGPLISLWAWAVLVTTVSGFGLVLMGVLTANPHDPVKMAIKGAMMTVLGITVLVLYFRHRPVPSQVPAIFAGAVVAETAVSVLIA